MSFYIKPLNLDLGDTAIENIFITEFMPMANGTFVKVYLLGLKYAKEVSQEGFNHQAIGKILNIPTSEVWEAWQYWEQQKLIKRHFKLNGNDFDVEFLSIKEQFITHNYVMKGQTSLIPEKPPVTTHQKIALQSIQQNFKMVCSQIEKTFNIIQLSYPDRLKINDYMENYYASPEILIYIVEWAVKNRHLKSIHQLKPILDELMNKNCFTLEQVQEYLLTKDKKYSNYKSILTTLGQSYKSPNQGEKDCIDVWLDDYGFTIDALNKIIAHLCKKTNNINFNYIDTVIKNLYEEKIFTFEGYINQSKEKFNNNKNTTNHLQSKQGSFDIFEGRSEQYTDEELEKLLNIK